MNSIEQKSKIDYRSYMTEEQQKEFDKLYINCLYKILYRKNIITEEQLIQLLK